MPNPNPTPILTQGPARQSPPPKNLVKRHKSWVSLQEGSQWQALFSSCPTSGNSHCAFYKHLVRLKEAAQMSPPLGSPPCLQVPSSLFPLPWSPTSQHFMIFFSPVIFLQIDLLYQRSLSSTMSSSDRILPYSP